MMIRVTNKPTRNGVTFLRLLGLNANLLVFALFMVLGSNMSWLPEHSYRHS